MKKNAEYSQDTAKSKVLIIYTGGTIGMVKTKDGFTAGTHRFLEELKNINELFDPEMPEWDILEFTPLVDSTDVTVTEWNKIGKIIVENYNLYDGFVVLHGTDTMAYSASALSFMLENLSKPVVFTGAQIPLSDLRSDGKDNIITSLIIAGSGKVQEVCLYFGGKLLRGNRSVKVCADKLLAFDSPEYPPLAEAGVTIDYNNEPIKENNDLKFCEFKNCNIGVIKVFPGISCNLFKGIMTKELNGLVIETFGAGNIPDYDNTLIPLLKTANDNGTIITICSGCVSGRVTLGKYKIGSNLKNVGVVSGKDMTTEAAVTKLYYLISCGYKNEEIKKLMKKNLRGELSEK